MPSRYSVGTDRLRRRAAKIGVVVLVSVAACSSNPPPSEPSEPSATRATGTGPSETSEDVQPQDAATPAERGAYYLSPNGSNADPGTRQRPWATLTHALPMLRPGDTLYLRGGTYRDRVRDVSIRKGTPEERITVRAFPNERPVVQGLLYVSRPSYWTFDGVNVTWDSERNASNEHLVKVTGGVGWIWRNSEIWGAQSVSNFLVAGGPRGEPADWALTSSCIHDTYPANDRSQDSNLYIGDMNDAGPGLVERNIIFNAPNGRNIKLGAGDTGPQTGPTGVTVRYNTLYNSIVPIVIAGGATDIVVERNILGGGTSGYLIRGYELTGANVTVRANLGFHAEGIITPGSGSLEAESTNKLIDDLTFDGLSDCDAFRVTASPAQNYGRYAPES